MSTPKTRSTARKAIAPIWLMVAIASWIAGVVLWFIAGSLDDVRSLMLRTAAIRDAQTEFQSWTAIERRSDQALLRRCLQGEQTTVREHAADAVGNGMIERLHKTIDTAAFDERLKAWTTSDEKWKSSLSSAQEWSNKVGKLCAKQAKLRAQVRETTAALRNELEKLQGKLRLARARSHDAPEKSTSVSAPVAIDEMLVNLYELTTGINDVSTVDSVDAIRDFRLNHLTPSLDRLRDGAERIQERVPAAESLVAMVSSLSEAILDKDPNQDLAELLMQSVESRRAQAAINVDADAAMAMESDAYQKMLAEIDRLTAQMREDVVQGNSRVLKRSIVVSLLGVLALLAAGTVLSRHSWKRIFELASTVQELSESRKQLVDVAELRKAHEQLAQLNAEYVFQKRALELACIVTETDSSGRIVFANDRFCEISGYTREEVLGKNHSIVGSGEHSKTFWRDMYAVVARDSVWQGTICNRAKNGKRFWVASTIVGFRNDQGRLTRYVSVRTDVTAREEAARKLVASRQALESQALALSEAKTAAEAASKAKSDFLATMSHEIRTPLNGVVGALDLLSASGVTEYQQRYVQIGRSSAISLLSIINDILDFSKIEAGKLELDPTDFGVQDLAIEVMRMLVPKASEKGLELSCCIEPSTPRFVNADCNRLRQIIVNLVNNAIKFTSSGTVTLRLGPVENASASDRTRLRFEIIDTGIGIPSDRLGRLFRAFSQTDASMSRKYGGTGLGLAICKQLVNMMGGVIGVESTHGQGSTFWFEVEVGSALSVPVSASRAVPVDLRAARVLIIDDHVMLCESLLKTLRSQGFEAVAAYDGESGLEALRAAAEADRPFTVVLLDYELPVYDGLDVICMMRSDDRLASTRVILMSAEQNLDSATIRALGFAAHRLKPISPSDLVDDIAQVLSSPALPTAGSARTASDTAALRPQAAPLQSTGVRPKVLLAEDNEVNQLIANEMLTKSGFDCVIVNQGRAAIDAVCKHRFDVVLMDCQMPEMDGFEATREIRRLEQEGLLSAQEGRRLPIVALTANALTGDRERCLEAGMDDFATKPINLQSLVAVINGVIGRTQEKKLAA